MKRFGDLYIRHARLVGALYCIVPALAWFVVGICLIPFREVYLLRLGLSVVVGGCVAAWVHEYGVKIWLVKHRSPEGPAGVVDGALIGAAVGFSTQILSALTSLIATNHPEDAKTIIIGAWLTSVAMGALVGSVMASVWGRQISTSSASAESQVP
jgi:uncharacterized RDD family membrane protein YckC